MKRLLTKFKKANLNVLFYKYDTKIQKMGLNTNKNPFRLSNRQFESIEFEFA
jgi:hypothetical protein